MLRWFREHGCVHCPARDTGIAQATGYRYLHEGTGVLTAQAPDLHEVLDLCRAQGTTDHDGHGLLALFDGQVRLGGQAATRAPEPVVVRLDSDAAGWLLLHLPFFLVPAACWWARHTWSRR
ncbi:hypothetical protein ACWDBD_16035 [Streptomyces sp. NPDC001118]